MKDPFHHRKNVQKKVIQSLRKESEAIKNNNHQTAKLPGLEAQAFLGVRSPAS